jgi:hypothetical protein
VRRAVDDLRRAERPFTANGQELESADAIVHLGPPCGRARPAGGADRFDEAAERYQHLGTPDPNLSMYWRCALTAAGWPGRHDEADAAISQLDLIHGFYRPSGPNCC